MNANFKKFWDFGLKAVTIVVIGTLIVNTIRNRVPGAAAVYDPIARGL